MDNLSNLGLDNLSNLVRTSFFSTSQARGALPHSLEWHDLFSDWLAQTASSLWVRPGHPFQSSGSPGRFPEDSARQIAPFPYSLNTHRHISGHLPEGRLCVPSACPPGVPSRWGLGGLLLPALWSH